MKIISLFAGIGGFDLGFARAGFETAAVVEIEANCRRLLGEKFPRAAQFADVRECGARNLPAADVLTFGFPCQDLSVAGKRAGLAGARSGLFYEALRIADECKLDWLVWENVPGLFSSDEGRDFARVLMALAECGYHGAWRVFDAQYFGLAQRRRRVFGVFARGDFGAERASEILSLREGVRGHPAPRREPGKGIAGTLRKGTYDGSAEGGDGRSEFYIARTLDCKSACAGRGCQANEMDFLAADTLVGNGDAHSGFRDEKGLVTHTLRGEGFDASEDGTGRGVLLVSAPVCSKWAKGSGGPSGDEAQNLVAVGIDGGDVGFALRAAGGHSGDKGDGGMNQTVVAQTITAEMYRRGGATAGNNPGVRNVFPFSIGVRRLMPIECERLQGFPDGWTAGFSDSARYRMLGNAVAVPVAEWIARRMMRVLSEGRLTS